MNIKSSCYNCKNRILGCHSNCDQYKIYKDQLELIKKNKELEKQRLYRIRRRSRII